MEELNRTLYLAINAQPDAPAWLNALARFSAKWVILIAVGLLAYLWLRGGENTRRAVFYASLTGAVALCVNVLVGLVWFHPRPFMIGLGIQLLSHAPETSFPSDHATLAFSLGFGLLAGGNLGLAVPALVAALMVAWSRVYVGVHFPFDMVGSLIVAGTVALVLRAISSLIDSYLLFRAVGVYRRACRILRLPVSIFRP